MNIAFIGYGSMTQALAPRFIATGHSVFLGGHNPEKAKGVADEIGASGSGDTAAAVTFGEVIVFATPFDKIDDAITAAGGPGAFDGKVVIDINNPVAGYMSGDFTVATFDDGKSLAETIADKLPKAEVAKAFNCCQAKVWAMDPPEFDGRRLVTMTAANGDRARDVAKQLIEATGSQPLDLGDFKRTRNLEAIAGVVIQLLFSGHDPHTALNLVSAK